MATPKKKKTGEGLYKKRYATLKEHRAAVAARKTLKGGKNIGPVAHGESYAKALAASKKKSTPKPSTGRTSSQARVADHSRPNQTKNGASLGSKVSAEEKARREKAASAKAMAEADKRKKSFDGVGPSDEQRRKDSSESAMKPKRQVTGSRRRFETGMPKREGIKLKKRQVKTNRRGRRIKSKRPLF